MTPDARTTTYLDTPVESYKHGGRPRHHLPHSNYHTTSNGYLGGCSTATMEPLSEMNSRRQVGGIATGREWEGDERGEEGRGRGEDLSPVSEKGGNVFELFRTYDGEEYTVYVREDGKRFYVDWEEEVGI